MDSTKLSQKTFCLEHIYRTGFGEFCVNLIATFENPKRSSVSIFKINQFLFIIHIRIAKEFLSHFYELSILSFPKLFPNFRTYFIALTEGFEMLSQLYLYLVIGREKRKGKSRRYIFYIITCQCKLIRKQSICMFLRAYY